VKGSWCGNDDGELLRGSGKFNDRRRRTKLVYDWRPCCFVGCVRSWKLVKPLAEGV